MDGDFHILRFGLDFSQPLLPNLLDCASLGLNIFHLFQACHSGGLTFCYFKSDAVSTLKCAQLVLHSHPIIPGLCCLWNLHTVDKIIESLRWKKASKIKEFTANLPSPPFPLLLLLVLGEETNSLLAITSFQGVVEGDKVSTEPLFLQAKLPQIPQLLLIGLVFQTLHHPLALFWTLPSPSISVL